MKNNLLFLTKKWKTIHYLEIDLDKHSYCCYDDLDEKSITNKEVLNRHFVNKELFNTILKALEESESYEENNGSGNASHLILEKQALMADKDARLSKEEVLFHIKNGFTNMEEKEINDICSRIAEFGAEVSNYLVEDILSVYKKYINHEISNELFANYAYFICYALGYNTIYKNDDINSMIAEIEWGFDGLSFCNCCDEDEDEIREQDPCFYSYIKSCCHKISCSLNGNYKKDTKINGKFKLYIFQFEWDCFMYLIKDVKTNRFNYGNFSPTTYRFNIDYFYIFMNRDEFYHLLEATISDENEHGFILDKKLDIWSVE